MLWPQTGFGLKRIVRNDSHEVPTGTIQTLNPISKDMVLLGVF